MCLSRRNTITLWRAKKDSLIWKRNKIGSHILCAKATEIRKQNMDCTTSHCGIDAHHQHVTIQPCSQALSSLHPLSPTKGGSRERETGDEVDCNFLRAYDSCTVVREQHRKVAKCGFDSHFVPSPTLSPKLNRIEIHLACVA